MEEGKQIAVVIDINFLKSLHQDLGTVQMVLQGGGLPETIRVEEVKAIGDVCEILEKMVAYIIKRQKENEKAKGQNA